MLAPLLAAAITLGTAHAQQPPSADEQTIRSLEEQERVAVLNGDVAAMERLWSERFIVNNPMGHVTVDRSGVLERVKSGVIRYAQFERQIEAIRIDGDVAIVMGSERVAPKSESGAAGPPVQRRYTNIWKRSGTTWRAIARHANVVAGK